MTTSVVVATAHRPGQLDACLAALDADEVLVVDNAPSAATRAVADRHGARWLPEPRPGKSHALNTGVAAARGEAVLFTDDDVVVQPGWSKALAVALEQPGVGAAAGRLLHAGDLPDVGAHAVHLTLVDHGPVPRDLSPDEVFGASLAVRADVLRRLWPPFDPRLGPRPGLKLGHEERRLAEGVRALGLRVVHVPDAVAEHRVDPARVADLRRTVFHTGVGEARRARLRGDRPAPLPRRVAELAVSAGRVARSDDLGAWAQLGRRLGHATGRYERLTDLLARRLAP